ncbi:tetratricopeptide repeat protein [Algoriphagus terrigena]|uniref:ATP-binding protein n=1 Tax=Algoriphagus terrigena TaxID=344884 RepID=UPI00047D9323|nr:tetratricopeptide repeat protein [Algoriphagus terrigena]
MGFPQGLNLDSLKSILPGIEGKERIVVLNQLATELREKSQAEALAYSIESDSLAQALGDSAGLSRALENIGWVYYRQGQWRKSFDFSQRAYDVAMHTDDKLQAARLMNNMGALYYEQQNYETAISQFKKGYELATQVNDLSTRIRSLNNIALNLVQINQLDSAMIYAKRAIKLNEDAGSPYLTSFANRVIGDVFFSRANYDSAQVIFEKSLQLARDQGVKSFEAGVLHRLGNAYLLGGKLDQAEELLLYSVEFCEQNNFLDELSKSHRYLASLYKIRDNIPKAYFHQSRFLELNDQLQNKANQDRLALLQNMFQSNLRDSELELLKTQNENQAYRLETSKRYIIFFAITAALIGVLVIRMYFLNKNVRLFNTDLLNQQRQIEAQNLVLEKQSVQLKAMNETKNKLFSILGHDMRGPVGQVKSVVDLLLAGDLEKEEFEELLHVLNKDIDSVNFTLNNTLKWSMSQMEGFHVNLTEFDLSSIVENSLKLLMASFSEKKLTIFNHMAPNVRVYADQDLIEVVIRNILNNAVKFSNPEDSVTIFSETDEKWVHWCVLDQGVGMSDEQIELILSDSYSLTKSKPGTNKEKGSGLGLQLAKEFTRKCGGEITIESHLGHGTKFWVRLPRGESIKHSQVSIGEKVFKG